MGHHRTLAILRDHTDPATRLRCKNKHAQVDEDTDDVMANADNRRRVLQRTLHQWEDFSAAFATSRDWLAWLNKRRQVAASKGGVNARTLEDLRQLVSEYEAMQQSLADEKSSMMQVFNRVICRNMSLVQGRC